MLTQVQKLVKVSELRRNLSKYLSQSATDPVVVSAGHASGSRVLLDSELYNRLLESFENNEDADVLESLVAADSGERIAWDDVKKKCRA